MVNNQLNIHVNTKNVHYWRQQNIFNISKKPDSLPVYLKYTDYTWMQGSIVRYSIDCTNCNSSIYIHNHIELNNTAFAYNWISDFMDVFVEESYYNKASS